MGEADESTSLEMTMRGIVKFWFCEEPSSVSVHLDGMRERADQLEVSEVERLTRLELKAEEVRSVLEEFRGTKRDGAVQEVLPHFDAVQRALQSARVRLGIS